MLAVLFTAVAALEPFQLLSLANADTWWHLSTGFWMMQNHAVPRTGLFSQCSSLPWVATNWGYEILLAGAYDVIGLGALPVVSMTLLVALAITVFLLARGSAHNFWPAVSLSASAQYAIARPQSQPVYFSMILFAAELALLLKSRRTGCYRPLLGVPLLLVVWANLHITFVYGIVALALLLAAVSIETLCRRSGVTFFEGYVPTLRLPALAALALGSAVAGTCSPYCYHLYALALKNARSTAYDYVADLHGITFRRPQDYMLLLLAMAAFFVLGRSRYRDLFQVFLLIGSSLISFAVQRDRWVIALVAVALIANALTKDISQFGQLNHRTWLRSRTATAGLVLIVIAVSAIHIPFSREILMRSITNTFPVHASDYIRQNHLPQPLFNEYQWGGFLTWYLPEYPVTIDARTDLYGDDLNLEYFKLINGYVPLESDARFARARTILLKRRSGLADTIRMLPRFTLVYSDDLAMVFERNN